MSGWFKVHRSIFDNELWHQESFTKAQAWLDIFGNANHRRGTFSVRGNVVTIERGQLGWSELTMCKRWRWSKNKVRRFLKWLETKQQITQQKTFVTTIITVLNYDLYQGSDTTNETADDTAERQQKDSRRYTNKNDKNEKNNNAPIGALLPLKKKPMRTWNEEQGCFEDELASKKLPYKRNVEALKLATWYNSEARRIRKSDAEYVGPAGYKKLCSYLKTETPEKIKEHLTLYINSPISHKFNDHPNLIAAFTQDTMRLKKEGNL